MSPTFNDLNNNYKLIIANNKSNINNQLAKYLVLTKYGSFNLSGVDKILEKV